MGLLSQSAGECRRIFNRMIFCSKTQAGGACDARELLSDLSSSKLYFMLVSGRTAKCRIDGSLSVWSFARFFALLRFPSQSGDGLAAWGHSLDSTKTSGKSVCTPFWVGEGEKCDIEQQPSTNRTAVQNLLLGLFDFVAASSSWQLKIRLPAPNSTLCWVWFSLLSLLLLLLVLLSSIRLFTISLDSCKRNYKTKTGLIMGYFHVKIGWRAMATGDDKIPASMQETHGPVDLGLSLMSRAWKLLMIFTAGTHLKLKINDFRPFFIIYRVYSSFFDSIQLQFDCKSTLLTRFLF